MGFGEGPQYIRDSRAKQLRQEHQLLQDMRDAERAKGTNVEALLVQGMTVETLFDEAKRLAADLLVLGSHGRGGLYKALTGSVSEQVIKRTRIPVMLIPPEDRS